MNKILLYFLLPFLFIGKISFSQQLSDNSKIYVIICSPGDELYQAFGHNAFWIVDTTTRVNLIYHYGTFNYADPNFYVKFIRGQLDYMLAAESYPAFMNEYTSDGRDVWKLELNLNTDKKNELYSYLKWKSLDANKYYKYDFFMDNCATRVRDVIEQIYGDSLVYQNNFNIKTTYRKSIKPYLQAKPWTRFGINLLLGLPADKKLDFYSAMYLPYYIDSVYNIASLNFDNSTHKLVTERTEMIVCNYKIGKRPFFNPSYLFWFLFVVLFFVTFIEFRKKKVYRGVNFAYFFITGVVSMLLLFMWFLTDHTPTKWNLNLIWAFPTHIYFAFLYLKVKKIIPKYLLIFGIVNILLVVTYPIFPQQFDIAMIPFLLAFGLRFLVHVKYNIK